MWLLFLIDFVVVVVVDVAITVAETSSTKTNAGRFC